MKWACTQANTDLELLDEGLRDALAEKAKAFDHIVKTGRTHPQDAMPIRLGQEFSGYAAQMDKGIGRARKAMEALSELPLGGTATALRAGLRTSL